MYPQIFSVEMEHEYLKVGSFFCEKETITI